MHGGTSFFVVSCRVCQSCFTAFRVKAWVAAFRLRGFAKLKNSKKKKLDRAQTPPIQIFFFGDPSVTWPEHSNHNNVQREYITLHSYHMSTYSPHWK